MSPPDALSDHADCADILAQTAFFSALTQQQIRRVSALGRIEHYPQNNRIYGLGDNAADFYVLVDGMVRFTIGLGSRQTHAGQILKRGELFGWAALVENAPQRIAAALAITACTVIAINGDQLLVLMDQDHTMGYRIMQQLNMLITGNLTSFASG
ncbi:MAG: cyclic nucleotide-binding domain-containing protein [Burkholderiales bacterium]|nr:cyclic nucleotide-binding domain-containing protein [Burkholderiales bacterium]